MQGTQPVQLDFNLARAWEMRAPFVLEMAAVGPDCFDCNFYMENNKNLEQMTCWQAFQHFINYGQFQMAAHRCARSQCLVSSAVPLAIVYIVVIRISHSLQGCVLTPCLMSLRMCLLDYALILRQGKPA